MSRMWAAAFVAMLVLPGAAFQEEPDDKEAKKQEQQKAEDEAKAVVKSYREKRKKARKEDDIVDAINLLMDAKPHRLIRAELVDVLDSKLPPKLRVDAAATLNKYKKDALVCDSLLRRAREERGPDSVDLRKRCLRSFGDIAPFAKAVDLEIFFPDQENSVARAAIEACESIKSVRSLRALIALLGELERIREDDGKDPGPGVPGGPPQQGDNNSKRKRKEDLLDPTKAAISAIFAKVDSKFKLKDYTGANRALGEHRGKIRQKQDEEDIEDRKP